MRCTDSRAGSHARGEVKVAVRPGTVEASKGLLACYDDFSPLYLATYCIENWVDTPRNMNDDELMEAHDAGSQIFRLLSQ
jgi:hypothetical protein